LFCHQKILDLEKHVGVDKGAKDLEDEAEN